MKDSARVRMVTALMEEGGFDALLATQPQNILMLTGYYPVLGQSVLLFMPNGEGALIVPESERVFAEDAGVRDLRTFAAVTHDYILPPFSTAIPLIVEACCEKGAASGVIGIEASASHIPATYSESYKWGQAEYARLAQVIPNADFTDATTLFMQAASVKTPHEIERITISAALAEFGFAAARDTVRSGVREVEVAAAAEMAIKAEGTGMAGVRRVDALAFCESSDLPSHSTNRLLRKGDSVIVRVYSQAEGYWTNIARTFFVGIPEVKGAEAYRAVSRAWEKAVTVIGEGVPAKEIDHAVQSELAASGYAAGPAGHGAGFTAADSSGIPVIHPASDDLLAGNMVFTLNPAVYPDACICDMVAVRGSDGKVISGMPRDIDWAIC